MLYTKLGCFAHVVRPWSARAAVIGVLLASAPPLAAQVCGVSPPIDDRIFGDGFECATPIASNLNDTGIIWSGVSPYGNAIVCDPTHPEGQDCHYGRDAKALAGTLTKVGAGMAGFDFTKISNNGQPLPASAALGSGPNDWACTRDNVTGLIWEVKTDDNGLRDSDWSYSWFNSASPDGVAGTDSGGTCQTPGRCDTEKYTDDVNAQGLCGANDWRMPSKHELTNILNYGIGDFAGNDPAIDPDYFPNMRALGINEYPVANYWTGSPASAGPTWAWCVILDIGQVEPVSRHYGLQVILVRDGQ